MARGKRIELTLEVGGRAEGALLVTAAHGREGLSEPFAWDVEVHPADGQAVPLGELVAQEAKLHLRRPGGAERVVHGEVQRARLAGVGAGWPRYALRIGPRLLRLGAVSRSRVFQDAKLVDVVKAVLDEHHVEHRAALSASYARREYVVQHQETDLAFVSRLLEEEGIAYRFDHSADGHALVLLDALSGDPALPDPLPPRRADQDDDVEWADELAEVHRAVTDRVATGDHRFEQPDQDLTAVAGKGDLERYEWPGGHQGAGEGKRRAQARLEEEGAASLTWRGRASCVGLAPGTAFDVEAAGQLRCVALETRARQSPGGLGTALATTDVGARLESTFVALVDGAPWRPPRRTPRPRVAGLETATVVGAAGEEIDVDRHGRIKVQLHWDREGARDERSSCWIRVAQRWAGPGFGASFVPRVGQEVLVRFLGGDPDRPLVAGAVYDGACATPLALPDEKTRSTVRTSSSLGGDGSNELRLEDAAGAEEVHVHAQRDLNAVVEHDATTEVKGSARLEVTKDRTRHVLASQTLSVKAHDRRTVGASQTLTVGVDRKTTVGARHDEKVIVAKTESVGRFQTVSVALASTESVGGASALNVGGGYAVNVGGAHNTAVGGVHAVQVGGLSLEVVGISRDTRVGGNASSRTMGTLDAVVEGRASFRVGGDVKGNVGGDHEDRVELRFDAFAKELVQQADKVTVAVNEKVALVMERSGAVTMSGATITIDGATIATRGAKVPHTSPASAARKAAGPKAKPKKAVIPRFAVSAARCGDEVGLQVATTDLPTGSATFTIDGKPKGGTLGTVTATLKDSKGEARWVSRKPKGTKQAKLKASASGISGKAEKDLEFHEYRDVLAETKVIACHSAGSTGTQSFAWTGKFDIALKDGFIDVVTRIKLIPRAGPIPQNFTDPFPPVGPPVSASTKRYLKTNIEKYLSGKWRFHRKGCKRGTGCGCPPGNVCCTIRVKVRVAFVDSGEHHVVNLCTGKDRMYSDRWCVKPYGGQMVWAHETGHLLGWYDEYVGGGVGVPPRWKPSNPSAIMGAYKKRIEPEYYWDFRDWLQAKTGEEWDLVSCQ